MIIEKKFLTKIKDFGLNSYESKVWVALLSRGVSTAGELSDIANVPRSRSYDVLESLEKKGFVVMKLGKPIKYIAVPPNEVVERVKKNMRKQAEDAVDRLDNLKQTEVLKELTSLHDQGVELIEPSELSGSLRGRHNLYNHLEMTLKSAEKSVDIMSTEQGIIRKAESLGPLFEELHSRGVVIRIAAPIVDPKHKSLKAISKFAEIRHTDTKARFIVVDGKEILFMVNDDEDIHPTYDIGIWVNTPFFASALGEMFELAWNEMKPVIKN